MMTAVARLGQAKYDDDEVAIFERFDVTRQPFTCEYHSNGKSTLACCLFANPFGIDTVLVQVVTMQSTYVELLE